MDTHEKRLSAALRSGGVSHSDIYATALKAAQSAKPNAKRVLDFGCGAGHFLPFLSSLCPDAAISAADIMGRPPSIPTSVEWYQGDLNDALPIPDDMFDLICAIEVIEHLENPRRVLREIFRLLQPGGVAILTTPNTGSIRSLITLIFRGHHTLFDDLNYPAHITPMSEIDFYRAGTEAGFCAPNFFYTNVGSIPKLLKFKWQQVPILGSTFKGRKFSDNVGAVFVKPDSKGPID
jgi:SAM-dependent methyltransferase